MRWQDPKLAELANQLTYSPVGKRADQVAAAEALLAQVDPDRHYPWEFVHYRLTGFRPHEVSDHTLSGSVLRSDLAALVEYLTASLALQVQQDTGEVLTVEQIAARFQVSTKTVQRWRQKGLVAHRVIFPDGRRRLGFPLAAVETFVATNPDLVERAGNFRTLTAREKHKIVRWARILASRYGWTLTDCAKRIARKLDRSPETIRYTLRNFDRQHPETAIFSCIPQPLDDTERRQLCDQFDQGDRVADLSRKFRRTRSSIYRLVSAEKAQQIKALKIDFQANPLFDHPDADAIILDVLPREARIKSALGPGHQEAFFARIPQNLPPELADIFRQPALPPELETDAFRRMNYLKCKAARLQGQLDPAAAKSSDVAEIEALLDQARTLKNQIVQSHMRIVVHVARKHARPGLPLMELVSDGSVWLMRAAEKFDFARGTPFSAYLSYALMKNYARPRVEQIARPDRRTVTGQGDLLNNLGDRRQPEDPHTALDQLHWQDRLKEAVRQLPPRERDLLIAHFGLDDSQPAMSLSQIGQKMGITKARVRQLETRALRTLRTLMEPATA